ncbi:YdcF family protein [Streptomyces rimosus]|uniref:YdcF family protein n=1 Tax=Streptomyces rimosus TaxID=1927 RepID=UPI0004C23F75|nr:YdcF family protein [Streptomyces rimosus]
MLAYALPALFFVLFLVGVLRDRRRFSNAVHLGLTVVFLVPALLIHLHRLPMPVAVAVAVLILLLPTLGILVLGVFLILNGVKMVRKEGRSLANLLSLLAGLGIFAVTALLITAAGTGSRTLIVVSATTLLVLGYVSFLFLCFVGYAFLYGRLRVRRNADFVVVLGSGLIGGTRVPPLLANRLERARAVYERQARRGNPPLLLTSGGQGPDEQLPESRAMAAYLTERGFPADRILCEEQSRTTEENLAYSKEIMDRTVPDHRCVIVTNNYHVLRAAILARRAGINGQVVGAPTAAYFWPSATIREFAAVFLSYKLVNLGICALLVLGGVLAWWSGRG